MTMKMQYYKTNVGYFVKPLPEGWYIQWTDSVKFDDTLFKDYPVLAGSFRQISELPAKVYKKKPSENKLVGFVLIDQGLLGDKFPSRFKVDEVKPYYDDDSETTKWQNFESIRSLYQSECEQTEETWEETQIEFELIREIQIDNFTNPQKLYVHTNEGNFGGKDFTKELSQIVELSELDTLLVPEFLWHDRPCSLTSDQTYKIIRHHVKQNIHKSKAVISSDYDFCFTVQKKIVLAELKHLRVEQYTSSPRSYKPPRFKNITEATKSVVLFEMTPATQAYKNYPVIEGFKGNNLQDLYNNLTRFLDELMQVINSEMRECPECKGTGHFFKTMKAKV